MFLDNYFTPFPSSSPLHDMLIQPHSQVMILHPAIWRIDATDRIPINSHYIYYQHTFDHHALMVPPTTITDELTYTHLLQTCALDPIPGCLGSDFTGFSPSPLDHSHHHSNMLLFHPSLKIPPLDALLTPTNAPFLYHLCYKPALKSSLYSPFPISLLLAFMNHPNQTFAPPPP